MSLPTFQLFVAGDSARSRAAEANFRRLGAERLHDRYELSIVDVTKDPDRAEEARILTTPTLVKTAPGPIRRVTGDFGDFDTVMLALAINPGIRR